MKSLANKLMTEPETAVQSCPEEVSEQILEYSNLVVRGVTTRCYVPFNSQMASIHPNLASQFPYSEGIYFITLS